MLFSCFSFRQFYFQHSTAAIVADSGEGKAGLSLSRLYSDADLTHVHLALWEGHIVVVAMIRAGAKDLPGFFCAEIHKFCGIRHGISVFVQTFAGKQSDICSVCGASIIQCQTQGFRSAGGGTDMFCHQSTAAISFCHQSAGGVGNIPQTVAVFFNGLSSQAFAVQIQLQLLAVGIYGDRDDTYPISRCRKNRMIIENPCDSLLRIAGIIL